MNRSNVTYLVIGVLAVVVVLFGYQYYLDHRHTDGVQINADKHGITIEKN